MRRWAGRRSVGALSSPKSRAARLRAPTIALDSAGATRARGRVPAGVIAGELHALLERAGVPPPYVLVGHSFGGLTMRILAARHPETVAGMVLLDPAHPEEWLEPGESARAQIQRGVRLCGYGAVAARLGIARIVATLVAAGALAPARGLTALMGRGELGRADEQILAPIRKLPPEARQPLRKFWTEPKFFEALASQIGTICESAAEARDAGVSALAGLPLIVLSASTTTAPRVQLHEALVRGSSRGRHRVAHNSGHWIPLDEPGLVAEAILEVVEEAREALRPAGVRERRKENVP